MRSLGKILVIVCLLLTSQSMAQHSGHGEHHNHNASNVSKSAQQSKLSDESIYNLQAPLLDEDGKKVTLESLKGMPVVISMAYTTCAYACPMIIAKMQQIEKELDAKKKKARFVLVSFDPKKDTPKVISEYKKKRKLDSDWTLFTAESDKSPREIANLLGIKYKEIEGGDYDHSFIITVLDSEGVILGQQIGANKDPKDLVKLLK